MSDWYYVHDNQTLGPVDLDELRRLIAGGTIGPDTLVWHHSLVQWQPARHISQLGGGAAAPRPPQPPGSTTYAPPGPRTTETSNMAIVAICVAGVGLVVCLPASIVGFFLGWLALNDINRSQGRLDGKPLAVTAMVLGGIVLLVCLLAVLLFVLFFAGAIAAMP